MPDTLPTTTPAPTVKHWANGRDVSPAYFHTTDAVRALDVILYSDRLTGADKRAVTEARRILAALNYTEVQS